MLTGCYIALVVLSVLIFPLAFRVDGAVDAFVDGGWGKLYLLGIRIFRVGLKLQQNGDVYTIYIYNHRTKKTIGRVNLTTNIQDRQSIVSIMRGSFLGNLRVSDSWTNVEIGRQSDAIFTAIALSTFRMAYTAFLSYVKSWQHIRTQERFVPVYDNNIFNIEFGGILRINIADIIYGTIVQTLRKKQVKKRISILGDT